MELGPDSVQPLENFPWLCDGKIPTTQSSGSSSSTSDSSPPATSTAPAPQTCAKRPRITKKKKEIAIKIIGRQNETDDATRTVQKAIAIETLKERHEKLRRKYNSLLQDFNYLKERQIEMNVHCICGSNKVALGKKKPKKENKKVKKEEEKNKKRRGEKEEAQKIV